MAEDKEKDNKFVDIIEKDVKSIFASAKKKGKVANITPKVVIIDVAGNGESIPFDASKHANLKIGDIIEF